MGVDFAAPAEPEARQSGGSTVGRAMLTAFLNLLGNITSKPPAGLTTERHACAALKGVSIRRRDLIAPACRRQVGQCVAAYGGVKLASANRPWKP